MNSFCLAATTMLLSGLLFSDPSWAVRGGGSLGRPGSPVNFRVGLHAISMDYNEDIPAPDRSREVGVIPAVEGGLRWWTPMGALDASIISSFNVSMEYQGTSLQTHQGVTAQDVHTLHDLELDYEAPGELGLSFVGGLQYHYWNRLLTYGSGYREIYQWWNLPLGVKYAADEWSADFMMVPMLSGTINVIFSETVTNGDNSTMTLGNTTGFRLRGRYRFTPSFSVGGWYESSSIGQSNSVVNTTPGLDPNNPSSATIHEPSSRTTRLGLAAWIMF